MATPRSECAYARVLASSFQGSLLWLGMCVTAHGSGSCRRERSCHAGERGDGNVEEEAEMRETTVAESVWIVVGRCGQV